MSQNRLSLPITMKGFTLIELMISIVLGLLISAAAISMFLTSQRSLTSQSAASDIQDDGLFGMETLVGSIRMANFGAKRTLDQAPNVMNETTPQGGVVITVPATATSTANVNLKGVLTPGNSPLQASLLTLTGSGPSNLNGESSDQLVIQRSVPSSTVDCEGNTVAAGQYVVERYFLRLDANARAGEPNALALACAAASYTFNNALILTNGMRLSNDLSGDGEILMNRVDQFRFLLGVNLANNVITEPNKNMIRYMTRDEYMALPVTSIGAGRPRIVSIKLSVVARSSNPTNAGQEDIAERFIVFGATEKLDSTVASVSNYQRQTYERTVFVRNARG